MDPCRVQFDHVSKRFRKRRRFESLGQALSDACRGGWFRRARSHAHEFQALTDVSFRVEPGAALGIIGPNGAGKSTALKILAGLMRPDSGLCAVRGRVTALIEVGAGFHGELTGRENVFLHGAILGMNRREMRNRFGAIVDFAGLSEFIDTPVKHYSSGMYARLGFSVAVHAEPDVLLVDEVLSVGDAAFRLRCMEEMRRRLASGTALVFVTHQMDQLQSICDKALVLSGGRASTATSPDLAIAKYYEEILGCRSPRPTDTGGADGAARRGVVLEDVAVQRRPDAAAPVVAREQTVTVAVTLRSKTPIPRAVLEVNLSANGQDTLISANSGRDAVNIALPAGACTLLLRTAPLPLAGGNYYCNVRLWNADTLHCELDSPYMPLFTLSAPRSSTGIVQVDHSWVLQTPQPAAAAPPHTCARSAIHDASATYAHAPSPSALTGPT